MNPSYCDGWLAFFACQGFSAPDKGNNHCSHIPPDCVVSFGFYTEQDELTSKIDHCMKENHSQRAAIGVVVNPYEGDAQRDNREEEHPEFNGANKSCFLL